MAMLRPGGKVLRIAEQTVPGLASEKKVAKKPKGPSLPYKIGVEETVIETNENGGRLPKGLR